MAELTIPAGVSDHGALTGLGDDDHPQYRDGTLAYTGNLDMGANNIVNVGTVDGVDISAHVADASIHFTEASIDHTAILNVGVNTHAQIDTHIADGTLHFTEASIDHTAILNVGTNTHAQIDTHIADATLHFTEASIDHTAILNVGTNSHAAIDTHIADASIHFADAPADDEIYARRNNAWVEIENVGGGGISGVWQFDSSTATGPSDGEFRYDNASYASVTEIFINDETKPGFDATNFLSALSSGDRIYIQNTEDSSEWAVWDVNAAVTDEGDWFRIPVDLVANGATVTDGKECIISILYGGSGGGTTDLQTAYDNSGSPPHITLSGANGSLTVRDNATPIGDLLTVEENSGDNILNVAPGEISIGATGNRDFAITLETDTYPSIRVMPDGRTRTSAAATFAALSWSSEVTTNVPGGAPFGNDVAPAMVTATGTIIFEDPGSLFSSSLLFNQATQVRARANVGPIYTLVNQPNIHADGGSFSCSQHNAVRAQPRWGPNLNGGSITQTSVELFFGALTVDATVGSASITTASIFAIKGVTLTAGGTIGTYNGIDIVDVSGPTNIRGINSLMNNGQFIRHVGTAPSVFAGDITINTGAGLKLGTDTLAHVELNQPSLSVLRVIGVGGTNNEGLDWDFDTPTANNIVLSSSTGASLDVDLEEINFGSGLTASGGNNWQAAFSPGARTYSAGATDIARRLFSAGGGLTIDAAVTNVFTDIVNEPFIAGGSGSATNVGNVLIQTTPSFGTNRYGLLVTSSPSGGTLNYCARFSGSAGVRVDGVFEHTGSTLGFFGTTPASQPAAYTPTNVTTDRSYDANSTTLDEIADVLGTLIADLQSLGLLQ